MERLNVFSAGRYCRFRSPASHALMAFGAVLTIIACGCDTASPVTAGGVASAGIDTVATTTDSGHTSGPDLPDLGGGTVGTGSGTVLGADVPATEDDKTRPPTVS